MTARLRIEATRTFDRPIDIVFRALSDERESPHWRGVAAADYDIGGPGVIGAKFWRSARRRQAFEVTTCRPYSVYATASEDGGTLELLSCRSTGPRTTEVALVLEQTATRIRSPFRNLIGWRVRRQLERQLATAAEWLASSAANGTTHR